MGEWSGHADWGAVRAKIHDGPELDAADCTILGHLRVTFDAMPGPRTGDYVVFADDVVRRISHCWDGRVQTSDDGSWYFTGAHMSFSGGLYPPVPLSTLVDTGRQRPAWAWMFHHGIAKAGNGVDFKVMVRVYTCTLRSDERRAAQEVAGDA